jgi:methanogenic corrinoid protein MtbC1
MAMPQAFHGNSGHYPHGSRASNIESDLERFLGLLMEGDRVGCRDLLREFIAAGHDAHAAMERLAWPACDAVYKLSREDQISSVHEHAALTLLTQLVQRLECGLAKRPARCKTIIVTSGRSQAEELAAEIFAGIAEADGFDVVFLGGGVESDDLFAEAGRRRPAFVVSFACAGADAPRLRRFIDANRRQTPVPGLRVGVGGGVFERVPGLAEEIGADLIADSPFDMLEAVRESVESQLSGRGQGLRRPRAA